MEKIKEIITPIEKRKLYTVKGREHQTSLLMDSDYVRHAGFDTDSKVVIKYSKDRIIIEKEHPWIVNCDHCNKVINLLIDGADILAIPASETEDGITKYICPVCEWGLNEIEIMHGSGGSQWGIEDVTDWMKKHGYEILHPDRGIGWIHIKLKDMVGNDDGTGEVHIPIPYILKHKSDFQSFKDIIEICEFKKDHCDALHNEDEDNGCSRCDSPCYLQDLKTNEE